jgi:hypothetical protein
VTKNWISWAVEVPSKWLNSGGVAEISHWISSNFSSLSAFKYIGVQRNKENVRKREPIPEALISRE